ncbi:hypothetical protein CHS0354_002231 [Potamilus streckersoni]|uniref:Uncharacterized protein n=1 Tax=Potamilus streckersoni TaxID=2493646 RepID=A0AAE0TB96_9BIVA|nr:hypothetical protein CHS0354_002231 [Potamilus streckersoni]
MNNAIKPISAAVSCNYPSDCAPGECCVSDARPRGKRDTSFQSTLGTCQTIGTEGSRCLVSHSQPLPSGMYYVCPCASGFKCLGTGQYDIPLGEIAKTSEEASKEQELFQRKNDKGSCRGPSTRIGQTCHSGADCATNECCVSSVRPIGRRRQLGGAHCQQMGVEGSGTYL